MALRVAEVSERSELNRLEGAREDRYVGIEEEYKKELSKHGSVQMKSQRCLSLTLIKCKLRARYAVDLGLPPTVSKAKRVQRVDTQTRDLSIFLSICLVRATYHTVKILDGFVKKVGKFLAFLRVAR